MAGKRDAAVAVAAECRAQVGFFARAVECELRFDSKPRQPRLDIADDIQIRCLGHAFERDQIGQYRARLRQQFDGRHFLILPRRRPSRRRARANV